MRYFVFFCIRIIPPYYREPEIFTSHHLRVKGNLKALILCFVFAFFSSKLQCLQKSPLGRVAVEICKPGHYLTWLKVNSEVEINVEFSTFCINPESFNRWMK